jgi:succinoglycan biosynthesis transport protein ExoP
LVSGQIHVSEYPLRPADESQPPAPYSEAGFVGPGPAYYDDDEEEGGLDFRRILAAVVRRKWLVLTLALLGVAAAVGAYRVVPVTYTATGSLWVDTQDRSNPGDVTPIRQRGLFETTAYLDLLLSSEVLLPVVERHDLYLSVDSDYRPVFDGLVVDDRLVRGGYVLTVGSGSDWTLEHAKFGPAGSGAATDPVGAEWGFRFTPRLDGIAPGTEIEFTLAHPLEAERDLRKTLETTTDRAGTFITVEYDGREPQRVTAILNSLLDRNVEVAAELKRNRLDETQAVLEEQLTTAQTQLSAAERELENFRVATVVLPSEQASAIAPGIQLTRGPAFDNYFEMRTELDLTRRDRERISAILDALPGSEVPIESLESIPATATSRELQKVLTELVDLRAQLRLLRDRYSDEDVRVQEVLGLIATISESTLPRILESIVTELRDQETRLQAQIDGASSELRAIPVRTIQEASLERQVQIQATLYNDLRSRVENARLAAASSIPDVEVLDYAIPPVFPSTDNRLLIAAALPLAGLLLGLLAALLLDRVDPRVQYPTQVDREMGLTILGSIPRVGKVFRQKTKDANQAAVLEAFRELRIATSFAFGSAGPLTITVTSPSAGEGKTFISVNLAVAFAELGRRTILIDADTRRGDAHHLLGIERTPGLTDYLAASDVGEIIHQTEHDNLSFIPSGTRGTNTPELLASHRMTQFLGTLKRAYDVVIVDAPPLTGGGDALVLSSLTGNMALVLRAGSTDRSLAAARVETLARFPFRILGAILNDTDPSGFHGYYPTYLPDYLTEVEVDVAMAGGDRLILPGKVTTEAKG